MDPDLAHAAEDLWVFGYGSLMWRPGFDFHERIEARLTGAHRALCVYSFVHRGTPERPGLVLGLDRGGACQGIAFRVAAADRAKTVAYLRGREQATGVYRECVRRVWPSEANFLLVEFDDAGAALERAHAVGVLVRDLRAALAPVQALRISIGSAEQNDRLLASLP